MAALLSGGGDVEQRAIQQLIPIWSTLHLSSLPVAVLEHRPSYSNLLSHAYKDPGFRE